MGAGPSPQQRLESIIAAAAKLKDLPEHQVEPYTDEIAQLDAELWNLLEEARDGL